MRKFIITSRKTESEITLTFRPDGLITEFKVNASTNEKQIKWLLHSIPAHIDQLQNTFVAIKNFKVIEVQEDLSFKNFWNTYNKKVGKLKMTENTWNNMSTNDKAKALGYIPTYNSQIIREGVQKAYPSTYLNQRYFDA